MRNDEHAEYLHDTHARAHTQSHHNLVMSGCNLSAVVTEWIDQATKVVLCDSTSCVHYCKYSVLQSRWFVCRRGVCVDTGWHTDTKANTLSLYECVECLGADTHKEMFLVAVSAGLCGMG